MTPIRLYAARRPEVLGALVSKVVFWGFQVFPRGRNFHAIRTNLSEALIVRGSSCFRKQCLNHHFRLLVRAFAKMMMANASARIDEVERGPILVAECAPDGIVVIDDDGILDP